MSRISIHPGGIVPSFMPVIILFAAACCPTVRAQVGAADYDTTWIPLQHTMSSAGDSLRCRVGTVTIIESSAGKLLDVPGDSVKITMPAGFLLMPDSVVTIGSSSTRLSGIRFDIAGGYAGTNGLQPGSTETQLRIKPVGNSGSGSYLSFMVKMSSTENDTLVVDGIYVQSIDTTNVMYDSTTGGSLQLLQIGVPSNTTVLSRLIALPGPAAKIDFGPASRIPNAYQTAGNIIDTTRGGSPAADTGKGIVIKFLDRMSNLTSYGTSVPKVRALLSLTNMPGNGTLIGTSVTHWYGDHHVAISFDSLSYRKAEKIDLEFTFGTSSINTITAALTSGITVAPGRAANISASITGKDEYAVDDTKKYNLMVTDKYFNPVNPTWVQARELTPHGGVFTGTGIHGDSICTGIGSSLGEAAFTFDPSNYFIGRDTLLFIARSSSPATRHYRDVLITPGDLGGIIVDYAGTVSGPSIIENVAAGEMVYVRAFLRDSFGNPINADFKSAISFSIASVLGKGMSLNQSGMKPTDLIEEPQYLNSTKAAIGMAIPCKVSTNVRATMDTVIAKCENYSLPIAIPIRSNVPASMKMVQKVGSDSSLVASDHVNSIVFSDTLRDAFGNLVEDPGLSVTVGPKHAAYAVCFSTKGLMMFASGPNASKVRTIDTLYPAAGVVSRSVSSGRKTGVDTLVSWSSSNTSVVRATPVWVTPGVYSRVSLAPAVDTVMSGETVTLGLEKLDTYGNHIDWGLPGGNTRLTSGMITKPSSGQITVDSIGLFADTVTTGHNRGGSITRIYTITGNSGVASIGGTLKATFPFTSFAAGQDTQKVYARLVSAGTVAYDTSLVVAIPTGVMKGLEALINIYDSTHCAGDSVKVTATAVDSLGHRIYIYYGDGLALTLNNTNVTPIATKDTTFYFTYIRNHKGVVRAGDTLRTTGASISDTLFNQGQTIFWLRKFTAENVKSTVTLASGGFTATSANGVLFKPLAATGSGAGSKWAIQVADTLNPSGAFSFTVVPRDQYYNIDSVNQHIVNIASNQTSGFNVGSNPKVVKGPTTFDGTLSGATGSLIVYVFNSLNSATYAQETVALTGQQYIKGDVSSNGTITAYDASLVLKHVVGDTSLTQAQLAAADVSGDGTVSAYDASLILRCVAGDTTVHFASMVKGTNGEHVTVSSVMSSGTVSLTSVEAAGSDGVLSMPVVISDPQNVNAVELSVNVGQSVDVQGVTTSLLSDWQTAYHTANGVLKIAMAGVTPLTSSKIATIEFKLAPQSATSNVTGTAAINENAPQALGSMEVATAPTKFGLDQNYPNPFNPTTEIYFELPEASPVRVDVYDILGRLVRTLIERNMTAGRYSVGWDGLNDGGTPVGAGVYFYRLNAGKHTQVKKMLMLR